MITAIVGLVGVIVGSVLTALLNFYLQKAAELRRWKREDERQQQLWEREDHTRFQADRLHLYRDFRVEAQRARNLERFTEAEMERMAAEIELISGPANVVHPAMDLLYDTKDLWASLTQGGNEDETLGKWEKNMHRFDQPTQDELGIPKMPYHPTKELQELPETAAKQSAREFPVPNSEGETPAPEERAPWWRKVFRG
jgi:hypothetical protein